MAEEQSGHVLADLVRALEVSGHEIGGDVMRRIPRGYPAHHPRASLLKHRSLTAARELETSAVRGAEPVHCICERLRPLLSWLATHTAGL